MTREQRERVRELRRKSPLDLGGDLDVQRPLFQRILSSQPVPTDAVVEKLDLVGVAALAVTISGAPRPVGTALYFHGGAFALGSADSSLGLVTQVARRSGLRVVTVDYRLAPEHPAPAAATDAATSYEALLDSGVGADEMIVIGESAGGGVALRLLTSLVAGNRPVPAGAVFLSPWIDLTLAGDSMTTRASVDVAVNREALARRVLDYAGQGAASAREHSPLFDGMHPCRRRMRCQGGRSVMPQYRTRLAQSGCSERSAQQAGTQRAADAQQVHMTAASQEDEGAVGIVAAAVR